jgi:hypothetical protein
MWRVAMLMLAVRSPTPDGVAERRPAVLTHADWLCYAQQHPLVSERYGMRTQAIRK